MSTAPKIKLDIPDLGNDDDDEIDAKTAISEISEIGGRTEVTTEDESDFDSKTQVTAELELGNTEVSISPKTDPDLVEDSHLDEASISMVDDKSEPLLALEDAFGEKTMIAPPPTAPPVSLPKIFNKGKSLKIPAIDGPTTRIPTQSTPMPMPTAPPPIQASVAPPPPTQMAPPIHVTPPPRAVAPTIQPTTPDDATTVMAPLQRPTATPTLQATTPDDRTSVMVPMSPPTKPASVASVFDDRTVRYTPSHKASTPSGSPPLPATPEPMSGPAPTEYPSVPTPPSQASPEIRVQVQQVETQPYPVERGHKEERAERRRRRRSRSERLSAESASLNRAMIIIAAIGMVLIIGYHFLHSDSTKRQPTMAAPTQSQEPATTETVLHELDQAFRQTQDQIQ